MYNEILIPECLEYKGLNMYIFCQLIRSVIARSGIYSMRPHARVHTHTHTHTHTNRPNNLSNLIARPVELTSSLIVPSVLARTT